MSLCRQICRKALRGCLRVPGCKPVCYTCLRPVCHAVSDSEDDDDSDKEDGHFFSNVHHIQQSSAEDIPLREHVATETSAVVEYYNDFNVLTSSAWQMDTSSFKVEHQGYTNVLSAVDLSTVPSVSNVQYTMCVSDDPQYPLSHDYVNVGDESGCNINGCDVPTNSSHQYHNIDQVCITPEPGDTKSHLDTLLIHNQGPLSKTSCPDLVIPNEHICNEKQNLVAKDPGGESSLQSCSLESLNKAESNDLCISNMLTHVCKTDESLSEDKGEIKSSTDRELHSDKSLTSSDTDQIKNQTDEVDSRPLIHTTKCSVAMDVTGVSEAEGKTAVSLEEDDLANSTGLVSDRLSRLNIADVVNECSMYGEVDRRNTLTSNIPDGPVNNGDVPVETSSDKSQTLVMLETNL